MVPGSRPLTTYLVSFQSIEFNGTSDLVYQRHKVIIPTVYTYTFSIAGCGLPVSCYRLHDPSCLLLPACICIKSPPPGIQLWSGNHISRVNERAKLKRLWARMLRAHTSPRRFSKPWPSVLSVLSSMHAHGGSGSGRSLSPLRRADLPSNNSNLDGRRRFHRQVRGARLKQYIGWRGEVEMEGSWNQTTTSHSSHDSNKHKQARKQTKSLIHCSFWVNPVSSSGLLHLVR